MNEPTTPNAKAEAVRGVADPLARILALVRILRGPGGCPWDREQTVASLTPYLQEETFEVVEAVASRDRAAYREELGDLLFLVLLLGTAGESSGWGDLDAVADAVVEKLIRRHPHVFGVEDEIGTDGALRQWEEIKREEGKQDAGEVRSALGRRPAGLPALTTAFRISEKAGAVGFQWPDVSGAVEKLQEEIGELRAEMEGHGREEEIEREIGDVLYSAVNVARYLGVDPERALRGTVAKFTERFRFIEARLAERGLTPEKADLETMDGLWDEAKRRGIPGRSPR